MLQTWWRKRPAQAGEDGQEPDLDAASQPLAVESAYAGPNYTLADAPQHTLNMSSLPFSPPPKPDTVSAAMTVLAVPELYFAFTGNQLPVPANPHLDEWWLPPPSPRAVKLVPRDVAPPPVRRPNYIDRIAMLHDLRGRFDPEQVAGLI